MISQRKLIQNNLSVLPEYRHNKIGYSLLEHSFEKAKGLGCTKMNIGIVEENAVLRSWYEKYGFVHTGAEKYDFFRLLVDIWKRYYNEKNSNFRCDCSRGEVIKCL